MLRLQQGVFRGGKRVILVFEGVDAGGKGGAIRRLVAPLDQRGIKVWPIGAPKPEEQGRHYLFRFWNRLPEPGTISIFDRSWYGRVLVERVEGFCSPEAWTRAYAEINEFERMLVDDGVVIIKIFLAITKEEQLRRFQERLRNPYKRWKLTHEDLRNREKWDSYVEAFDAMFAQTSTPHAPWIAIPANSKWYARIEVLKVVTARLAESIEVLSAPLDPLIQQAVFEALGLTVDD